MISSSHNKSVLFVCDFPFANAGGVGRVTETLALEFMQRGMNVAYFAVCSGEESVSNGVAQYFIPDGHHILCSKNILYFKQILNDLRVDIIINQAGVKPKVLDFLSKSELDVPILSVHHNCVRCLHQNYKDILAENSKSSIFIRLVDHPMVGYMLGQYHRIAQGLLFRKALRISQRLVLLSKIFVPELEYYVHGFPGEKVVGIPNPAPFAVVRDVQSKKENRLIYVGRLNFQQKRSDLLLEVWVRLYKDYPDWHFDVVGDGSAKNELEEKTKILGLERIAFHGYQDPRPYLEKAKLFCMTSSFEGFPMVLVEAQAYGVVPFAFNCFSAIFDIIQPGVNGYVIPKFYVENYVQNLKLLMNNDNMRKRLAMQAQESVAKYHPVHICDKWIDLFDQVEKERISR